MNQRKLFILALFLLPISAKAECRLGVGETHLTVQRVMRNFGSFTLKAESVTLTATNPWSYETVSEADISEAIEKLGFAINCAEEVLKDPTGDILPSRISSITDEKERSEKVDDFVYFMTEFKDVLNSYRDIFKGLQAQKPADRNFKEAKLKLDELNDIVERAHRKL
ncbi:MAG: hypothetical protein ACXWRE_04650 [Pseudobdellovibrionaceae bacterium]